MAAANNDTGPSSTEIVIRRTTVPVNNEKAFEQIAAMITVGNPLPAVVASNIRVEQVVGVIKKLTGRGISAKPMTLREAARSNFEGVKLVLIIPDVGGHGEVDAVIDAAKRANVEHRIISRKSSSWDADIVEPENYKRIVDSAAAAAESYVDKRVADLRENGDDARVLSWLTEGIREHTFVAAAARVKLVELKFDAELQKTREELGRAKTALDAARADDEAARALLTEAENDLRAAREELNTLRADQKRDLLQAAERFRTIIDERDKYLDERNNLAVEVEALKKTLAERQSAAPVADQGALARAVAAALPAVRAGLLEPAEALERIARLVGGVA